MDAVPEEYDPFGSKWNPGCCISLGLQPELANRLHFEPHPNQADIAKTMPCPTGHAGATAKRYSTTHLKQLSRVAAQFGFFLGIRLNWNDADRTSGATARALHAQIEQDFALAVQRSRTANTLRHCKEEGDCKTELRYDWVIRGALPR